MKQVGKKNATQPDKHGFLPTTYERTQLTYDEAVQFGESLKVIRKRIAEANVARTSKSKLFHAAWKLPPLCRVEGHTVDLAKIILV